MSALTSANADKIIRWESPLQVRIMKYQSGEEIRKDDRVLFHGEPGEIELVATDKNDVEERSFLEEYGAGIMIREPKVFGRAFIDAAEIDNTEHLVFVSRVGDPPNGEGG